MFSLIPIHVYEERILHQIVLPNRCKCTQIYDLLYILHNVRCNVPRYMILVFQKTKAFTLIPIHVYEERILHRIVLPNRCKCMQIYIISFIHIRNVRCNVHARMRSHAASGCMHTYGIYKRDISITSGHACSP